MRVEQHWPNRLADADLFCVAEFLDQVARLQECGRQGDPALTLPRPSQSLVLIRCGAMQEHAVAAVMDKIFDQYVTVISRHLPKLENNNVRRTQSSTTYRHPANHGT